MNREFDPTKNPIRPDSSEPCRANARMILRSSLTTKGNPDKLYYVVETDDLGHWKNHKLVSIKWPGQEILDVIAAYNRGEQVDLSLLPEALR